MLHLYRKLKESEQKLDETIEKKALIIEDEHNTRLKCIKTLRIFLTQIIKENSYTLRLDGKVLNDLRNNIEMKTSEILKRVIIVFNDEMQMQDDKNGNIMIFDVDTKNSLDFALEEDFEKENHSNEEKDCFVLNEVPSKDDIKVFEWHALTDYNEDHFDSFELRVNEIPKSVKIIIDFDNSKDLVKLSQPLQKILKMHTTSRTKALIEFWKYVRLNKLINKDGSLIMSKEMCDVIPFDHENKKTNRNSFVSLDKITWLMNRFSFLDPDFLSFCIPVKDYERIFDIKIEKDDFTDPPRTYKNNLKNIGLLNSKIDNVLDNIKILNDRVDMLDHFIHNPVSYFIKYYYENIENEGAFFSDPKFQQSIFDMLQQNEQQ